MSSSSIRAKIKSGLKKAIAAVGSSDSDKIYKINKIRSSGGTTPIDLPVYDETPVLLVDAIFQSYDTSETSGTVGSQLPDGVRKGDKKLVSNSDVVITEGDTIRQGSTDFIVVSTDTKAPTSEVLVYTSQLRES